jgi:hypothetical protein
MRDIRQIYELYMGSSATALYCISPVLFSEQVAPYWILTHARIERTARLFHPNVREYQSDKFIYRIGAAVLAVEHIRFEALFGVVTVVVGADLLAPGPTGLLGKINNPRPANGRHCKALILGTAFFAAALACLRSVDLVGDRTYLGQGRCAPAPPVPPTARRHPCLPLRAALCQRQVGTKGWSFPIEQRDTAIDLKTHQHRSTGSIC